ncbi:helix-turn-helix domain-containing protein [Streptomyces sp. NPDC059176]|uniref:helix-turn-helix domain-containing protein n=1 Tax=Streptomyces sp. NPDC059176 TaxID=3346758 RepID=UPI003694373A
MSGAGTRVGVGTRFLYDGEAVEVVELAATTAGNEVVLRDGRGRVQRLSLKELLFSDRARVLPDGPGPSGTDVDEVASVVLDQLDDEERELTAERAGDMREVLTGYRSGSPELAAVGEPQDEYAPAAPMEAKKAAKAAELGVTVRTIERWLAAFRDQGEAGLAPK